eukprot:403336361
MASLTDLQFDEIIIKRIQLGKADPVSKVTNLLSTFDSLSEDQCNQQVEDILTEIENTELFFSRSEAQFTQRLYDHLYHQQISQEITQEIATSKNEMINLQIELEQQRKLKQQKAEYEGIAKAINEYPSQEESLSKIEECLREKESYEIKAKDDEIILRQKQLHTLVSMIHDLKNEVLFDQMMTQDKAQAAKERQQRNGNEIDQEMLDDYREAQ